MADIDINSLVIGDSIALDISDSDSKKPATRDQADKTQESSKVAVEPEELKSEDKPVEPVGSAVFDDLSEISEVDESTVEEKESSEDEVASEEEQTSAESAEPAESEEPASEKSKDEAKQLSFEEAVGGNFTAAVSAQPRRKSTVRKSTARKSTVRKRAAHANRRASSPKRRHRATNTVAASTAQPHFSREFFSIIVALICAFLLVVSNSLAWADQAKREEARLLVQDSLFTETVKLYPPTIDLLNIHPAITDPAAFYLAADSSASSSDSAKVNQYAEFTSVPIYAKLYGENGAGTFVIRKTDVDETDKYGQLINSYGPMDSTLHGLNIQELTKNDVGEIKKIEIVDNFPASAIPSVDFSYLSNCSEIIGLEKIDISNVVSLKDCFANDVEITELDLSSWNTSNVESLNGTFRECEKLEDLKVADWDTSKVEDFSSTFFSCDSLATLNVSAWDTSSATSFASIFQACISLESLNLSSWNTSNVENINSMFNACSKLTTINVNGWDTRKIEKFNTSFANCSSLANLNLSSWQITSSATEISNMFVNCSSLTSIEVSNWDTSNVKNMRNVFKGCSKLSGLDLSKWNTARVADMEGMFDGCSALQNLDVSGFDTSKVTNMRRMFFDCSSLFTLDISKFKLDSLTNAPAMFSGCDALTSLDLRPFKVEEKDGEKIGAKLTDLNDGNFSMFTGCGSLSSIDLTGWDLSNVKNYNYLFADCVSLRSVTFSDTMTNGESMRSMFETCTSLEIVDLTAFPSDSITDMSKAFKDCTHLRSVVMPRKTDDVEKTASLFENCSLLSEVDMSGRKFGLVTDFKKMFYRCSELKEIELLDFDTSEIKKDAAERQDVFTGCANLRKVTFGNYVFPITLPTPNPAIIEGATGQWQDEKGNLYSPTQVNKAGVYVCEIDESVVGVPKPTEGDPNCSHQAAEKYYVISEPSCDTGGIYRYCCVICPAVYDVEIPHLEHAFEKEDITEPTCLLPGYSETVCSLCGFSSGHSEHKEALGHVMDSGVITQPTCTEPGYTTFTCQREDCGFVETKAEVPALGHHMLLVYEEEIPTCESSGRNEYRECDHEGCGFAQGGELIDALGHEWKDPQWSWASDYSAASIKAKCNRNALHEVDEKATITTREDPGSTVIMADVTYDDDMFSDAVRIFEDSSFVVRGEPVINGFDAAYVPDETVSEGQSAVLRVERVDESDADKGHIHKALSALVDKNEGTLLAGVYSAELFIGNSTTPVHDGFGTLTLLVPVIEAPGVADPSVLDGLDATVYHCHKNDTKNITAHGNRVVENGVIVLEGVEDLSTFATEVERPAEVTPPPSGDDPSEDDETYNITASAVNGTVTPTSVSVKKGAGEKVTITYNSSGTDYTLKSITVNGEQVEGASDKTSGSYELTNINANTEVIVEFEKYETPPPPPPRQDEEVSFTVTASAVNGTATPASQTVEEGGSAQITYKSDGSNFTLSSITVNDAQVAGKSNKTSGTYTLENVNEDTTVVVTFAKAEENPPVNAGVYTIKATAINGTVTPEEQSIPKDSTGVAFIGYNALSNEYALSAITINGKNAPSEGYIAPNVYQLSNITSDTNVEIVFSKINNGGDGSAIPNDDGDSDDGSYSSNPSNNYKGLASTGSSEMLLGLFGVVVMVILVLGATFLVLKRRRL